MWEEYRSYISMQKQLVNIFAGYKGFSVPRTMTATP